VSSADSRCRGARGETDSERLARRPGGPLTKAVAWHGTGDVRVDTVPDPRIEQATDAIVRLTSTAICESDLHLYDVMAPFVDERPLPTAGVTHARRQQLVGGRHLGDPAGWSLYCGQCWRRTVRVSRHWAATRKEMGRSPQPLSPSHRSGVRLLWLRSTVAGHAEAQEESAGGQGRRRVEVGL
jgi:hypothetical protein